jgi:uncharacterized protein
MGRILFWVLLGLLVYVAWRWWSFKRSQRDGSASGAAGRKKKAGEDTMVPCDVCGLNVPQSEAYAGNGRWYCSDEHRQRGPG